MVPPKLTFEFHTFKTSQLFVSLPNHPPTYPQTYPPTDLSPSSPTHTFTYPPTTHPHTHLKLTSGFRGQCSASPPEFLLHTFVRTRCTGKRPIERIYYKGKHEHRKMHSPTPTAGLEPNLNRHCWSGRFCALVNRGTVTERSLCQRVIKMRHKIKGIKPDSQTNENAFIYTSHVQVKGTLQQAMKAQRGSRGTALLFLCPRL
jgi:hypothetical protein